MNITLSKLPATILKELKGEAKKLDIEISSENPEKTEQLLSEAELFKAASPPENQFHYALIPMISR